MSPAPGPWSWEAPNVYDAEGGLIAYLLTGYGDSEGRLIAAAPDLLAALKEMLESFTEPEDVNDILDRARFAVRKAEEREP